METTTTSEIEIVPPAPKGEQLAARPTTARARIMTEALKEETEQRALLQQYIQHHMKEGTDFGVIPGTQKPTLLKPGAEKLTDLFRCTPEFDLSERVEDWEKGLFHYEFRVRIKSRDTGSVLAEGVGSANSREGRYRWRNAARRCPSCGKEAIIKGKEEYGGGWVCFKKKDGCGAKFSDGDAAIEGQESGKVENDDIYTMVNTILKMAKKRALVDGAIALARCSDIFTQDVEDFAEGEETVPRQPAPPKETQRQRAAAVVNAARAQDIIRIWIRAQLPDHKEKTPLSPEEKKALGIWAEKTLGHPAPTANWTDADMDALEADLAQREEDIKY